VRQRALIHIDGPRGAGKTALVEALLADSDYMISAVRCVRDDTLPEPCERLAKSLFWISGFWVGVV
jgi:Ni2+-binding GTPase involved in maturation of urease and hydrogenase